MKLIIINGTTGIGKSSITSKLHEDLPLSFLLEIDVQRRNISQYREFKKESHGLAYDISLSIIASCLKNNIDIIIDKMIDENAVLESIVNIGEKYNADIYEFLICADKEIAINRVTSRGFKEGGLLKEEKVIDFWERMEKLKEQRVSANIINTSNLNQEEALEATKRIIFD